jgi:hypothetical protein
LRRNDHGYGKWDMVYGPEGHEKIQTDRNPGNFTYKSNILHHSVYELRHIYGDMLYQVYRRFNRLADPFQLYVVPSSLAILYLLSGQHIAFFVSFFKKEHLCFFYFCFHCKNPIKNRRTKIGRNVFFLKKDG